MLLLLTDYLKVIVNLSLLTTDTMSRVIEFLKAFNSRTCQVVLGAGAMRSAGLKNITAKHLALASQSLSVVIALIPYVRETFRRHLSPKQAVMLIEFDKLKRDYQEHQNEIHAKLIAIMGDRLSAHIKSLNAIRWDAPPAKPGTNEYMELLVKETVTLHKVLSRYLASAVVEYVMTQVFAAINHRLSEEYTKIDLPTLDAKERLLTDARYLHEKFAVLKTAGAPTALLETLVADKRVTTAPISPPRPTAPTPASPLP
jgi:vacuolar protein sorting-associated protein 54